MRVENVHQILNNLEVPRLQEDPQQHPHLPQDLRLLIPILLLPVLVHHRVQVLVQRHHQLLPQPVDLVVLQLQLSTAMLEHHTDGVLQELLEDLDVSEVVVLGEAALEAFEEVGQLEVLLGGDSFLVEPLGHSAKDVLQVHNDRNALA